MSWNRFLNVVRYGGITISITVGASQFLLHTYLLPHYQETLTFHRNGYPVRLMPKVKKIAQDAFDKSDTKLKEDQVTFFPVIGCEAKSIGNSKLGNVAIGVPFNYLYDKVEDIDSNDISLINNQGTDWTKQSAQKMLQALVLTPKAKKYEITRELYQTEIPSRIIRMFLAPLSIIFGVILLEVTSRNYLMRWRIVRTWQIFAVAGALAGCICLAFLKYCCLSNILNIAEEKELERRIVQSNDISLIEGGIEFYQNQLQRNIAFRDMLGEQGSKYFYSDGNLVYGFFNKHFPINERLEYLAEHDKKVGI